MGKLAEDFTAAGVAVAPATVAAWCVGRWPNGTPLALAPDRENDSSLLRNAFLHRDDCPTVTLTAANGETAHFPGALGDRAGRNCPFFAHIRKVNPRDSVVDVGGSGVTLKSQMLRRGVPYGADWTDESNDLDRGLFFMSYQTSTEHQFHRLMTLRINSAVAPPPGQGIDPLIGSEQGGRTLTRRGPASKKRPCGPARELGHGHRGGLLLHAWNCRVADTADRGRITAAAVVRPALRRLPRHQVDALCARSKARQVIERGRRNLAHRFDGAEPLVPGDQNVREGHQPFEHIVGR
jgi:hypothetical protein